MPRSGRVTMPMERALIWAYQEQNVDQIGRISSKVGPAPVGSQFQSFANYAALETQVDSSRAPIPTPPVDAETIHDAVMCLPSDARELVILHAKAGSVPGGWQVEKIRPKLNNRGEVKVIYDDMIRRRGRGVCYFLKPQCWHDVLYRRGVYSLWQLAISSLYQSLSGCMDGIDLRPPICKPDPWKKTS